MAADDWTYLPSTTSAITEEPRVRVAAFGDGYEQRVADGINTLKQSVSVGFLNRKDTDAAAMLTQLEGYAGVTAFLWTPPGGSQAKYVCRKWTRNWRDYNHNDVTAVFEKVFES